MTLNVQFATMLVMTFCGIYLGFATETYYRLKEKWQQRIFHRFSCEIIYWIVQAFVIYVALYRVNYGQFRFYVVLACLLGVSMYIVLFQRLYKRLLEFLIQGIERIGKKAFRLFSALFFYPLYRFLRLIIVVASFIAKHIFRLLLFLLTIILFPVRKVIDYGKAKILKKLKKDTQIYSICSTIRNKLNRWLK